MRTTCQRIGHSPTSTSGLGISFVRSWRRVPRPPLSITTSSTRSIMGQALGQGLHPNRGERIWSPPVIARSKAVVLAASAAALLVSRLHARPPRRPGRASRARTFPALSSVAAGDVVAFAWVDGWHQVAVQVDERKQVDFGTVYNSAADGLRHDRLRRSEHVHRRRRERERGRRRRDRLPGVDAGLEAPGDAGNPAGTVAGLRREGQPQHAPSTGRRSGPGSTSSSAAATSARAPASSS